MCQMSVKLPAKSDQNPSHTFDEIVEKQITTKMLSKLDLEPKCQGHSRNQKTITWRTKNMPPKNLSRGSLSNWCQTLRTVKQYVDPTLRGSKLPVSNEQILCT